MSDPFNRVLFYSCGAPGLFTPGGVVIRTQSDPEVTPPSIPTTTNQQPTNILIEQLLGAQRFG